MPMTAMAAAARAVKTLTLEPSALRKSSLGAEDEHEREREPDEGRIGTRRARSA